MKTKVKWKPFIAPGSCNIPIIREGSTDAPVLVYGKSMSHPKRFARKLAKLMTAGHLLPLFLFLCLTSIAATPSLSRQWAWSAFECQLHGPAHSDSPTGCMAVYSKYHSQIADASSVSINSENLSSSAVRGLLLTGCPSAVVRLIIPVIVYPVNTSSVRSFTHVRQEVLEGHPSLTDRYSSATIVVPCRIVLVCASPNHAAPYTVGFGFGLPVCACEFVSNKGLCSKHGIGQFFALFSGGRPATTGAHCDLMCHA